MAGLVYVYNKGAALLSGGGLDWVNDTDIKCMLLTDSYTLDLDHDFVNDISAVESSGAGYSAGGVAVANKTLTIDNANDKVKLSCDTVNYGTVSVTYRYAVFYKNTCNTATSPLVLVNKFDSARTVTAAALTLTITDCLLTAAMPGFGF